MLLVFPLGYMLRALQNPGGGAPALPRIAAFLAATCPYLVFYDRLTAPDSLFVTESVLAAWLSLRVARAAWAPDGSARAGAGAGAALGAAIGLAMLTRQNFSYVLWLLPPLAFFAWRQEESSVLRRSAARRFLVSLSVAIPVALAIWSPYLIASSPFDVLTRVFYHSRYVGASTMGTGWLLRSLAHAAEMLSPAGWYATYLTPPIALLALAGLVWMLRRGAGRLAAFLLGWSLLTFFPLVLFAGVLFPRYGLPAAVPLLLAAAYPLGRLWNGGRVAGRVVPAAAVLLAVAWPVAASARQWLDWRRQPFVEIDRAQFVRGWTAGSAIEDAIDYIRQRSREKPLVVVNVLGDLSPNLAVSVALERDPRVRVVHSDWGGLLASVESWRTVGRLYVRSDFRPTAPVEELAVPEPAGILVVRPEPLSVAGRFIRAGDVSGWGGLRTVASFRNPADGAPPGAAGAIFVEEIAPPSAGRPY